MPASFTNFSSSSSFAKAMPAEELKLWYKRGPQLAPDHTSYKRMRNIGKSSQADDKEWEGNLACGHLAIGKKCQGVPVSKIKMKRIRADHLSAGGIPCNMVGPLSSTT